MRANGPEAGTGGRHGIEIRGGAMIDTGGVGVFLGLDVGTSTHHGHGQTSAGKKPE